MLDQLLIDEFGFLLFYVELFNTIDLTYQIQRHIALPAFLVIACSLDEFTAYMAMLIYCQCDQLERRLILQFFMTKCHHISTIINSVVGDSVQIILW